MHSDAWRGEGLFPAPTPYACAREVGPGGDRHARRTRMAPRSFLGSCAGRSPCGRSTSPLVEAGPGRLASRCGARLHAPRASVERRAAVRVSVPAEPAERGAPATPGRPQRHLDAGGSLASRSVCRAWNSWPNARPAPPPGGRSCLSGTRSTRTRRTRRGSRAPAGPRARGRARSARSLRRTCQRAPHETTRETGARRNSERNTSRHSYAGRDARAVTPDT